jgi:hypothetical protein
MAMDINDVTKKLTDIAIKIKNEEIQELLIALRIHISEISAENTKNNLLQLSSFQSISLLANILK